VLLATLARGVHAALKLSGVNHLKGRAAAAACIN
jgi:hypothetical protein